MNHPKDTRSEKEKWFDGYMDRLNRNSVLLPPQEGIKYRCPCCHNRTLDERGGFDICPVCFWEDDGQDDEDVYVIRGGPNGRLSLDQARENYRTIGACDERFLAFVRLPTPDENRE
jgi:hypothetical protein